MSDYLDYLRSQLALFGVVQFRPMFGAYGVYHQGVMFALVSDQVLYLKVDDSLVCDYQNKGLLPFSYTKKGKTVNLSYYQAPEDALEDPDELASWAARSFEVAMRAKQYYRLE